MSTRIYNYSSIATSLGPDDDTEGMSHAILVSARSTLCGISDRALGSVSMRCLSDTDGHVDCKDCMDELYKRNIVGAYVGPGTVVADHTLMDGVLLEEFGWGILDDAFEGFFAYGHHEPGVVLGLASRLAKNQFNGWEEYQTTLYLHWRIRHESDFPSDGPSYCFRVWRKTDTPDDEDTLRIIPIPYQITVLRYKAWPLLVCEGQDRETEFKCLRLKAWYEGSTKLDRAIVPGDMDTAYAPGFTIFGKPQNHIEATCLEWPTPDFDVALERINYWQKAGATELCLVIEGMHYKLEWLTPADVSRIRQCLKFYGHYMLIDALNSMPQQAIGYTE